MTTTINPFARTLRVGLDLDGVNFWFDRSYHRGCIAIGVLEPGTPRLKATRWNFYEDYGHSTTDFVRHCDVLADLGMLWAGGMIAGAATAWDAIADAGHEIHVITDRSFGTHPIASAVGTRMWLAQHRRVFHSLTFTPDKASRPTDIMLEDKLENYDALDAAGCQAWLINRPWNLTDDRGVSMVGDGRRRVDTHEEFVQHVHALAHDLVPA